MIYEICIKELRELLKYSKRVEQIVCEIGEPHFPAWVRIWFLNYELGNKKTHLYADVMLNLVLEKPLREIVKTYQRSVEKRCEIENKVMEKLRKTFGEKYEEKVLFLKNP